MGKRQGPLLKFLPFADLVNLHTAHIDHEYFIIPFSCPLSVDSEASPHEQLTL